MPRKIATHRPLPDSLGRATFVRQRRLYDQTPERRMDKDFYKSPRWRRLRAAYLAEHPLCAKCDEEGRTTAARHVHHVKERKQFPELAFEWDNLQSLCVPCHSRITGYERGK